MHWSHNAPVAGQQFEYRFDGIGNGIETRTGGDQFGQNLRQASYYANLLNQYTSRDVPRYADIMGVALATATVTVTSPNALNNGQAVYRRGEFFRKELAYSSGTGHGALWEQVTVSASGGESQSGYVFVPKTPEVFTYDLDGNLASDGRWNYYWDGENRLVKVESRSDTPQGSWRRVECAYDGLGRRVRQRTSVWTNNTWQVIEDLKFVSDAMLCGRHIAELNATNNSLVRSYVWGLDLSGTMDGAGGVGGLLWVNQHTGSSAGAYFCAYDGNGNVVALVSANTGTETARYEYGLPQLRDEPIRVTGPMSKENPFRFSIKRTCNRTDLVLHEYRAYRPSLGGWPNRDPIKEPGHRALLATVSSRIWPDLANLYGFVHNNPVGGVEKDGRIGWIGGGIIVGVAVLLGYCIDIVGCRARVAAALLDGEREADRVAPDGSTHRGANAVQGGDADALTHCIAACNVGHHRYPCFGPDDALHQLQAKETGDDMGTRLDRMNNEVGIGIGYGLESGQNCTDACLEALRRGLRYEIRNDQIVPSSAE